MREPGKLRYGLVFTIRHDVKKDKKEETVNLQFHWGGLDLQNRRNFQRFSVKQKQARGERESESRASGGMKNKTTKTHLSE